MFPTNDFVLSTKVKSKKFTNQQNLSGYQRNHRFLQEFEST